MAFQHGVSGIAAATKQLDAIGNNVSNAGTVGFKSSRAEFSDMFAANFYGVAASQTGLGTKTDVVAQQFTQGNILPTGNQMDMAISGNGFFVLNDMNGVAYSRNGQFKVNREGYIVSNSGANLQGWAVDQHGNIMKGTQTNLRIDNNLMDPRPTDFPAGAGRIEWSMAFDSRTKPISKPVYVAAGTALAAGETRFDPKDASTYTHTTSTQIYDSLGNPYKLNMYFIHKGGGKWDAKAMAVDELANPDEMVDLGVREMVFDEGGKLISVGTPDAEDKPTAFTHTPALNARNPGDPPVTKISFNDFNIKEQIGTAGGGNPADPADQVHAHTIKINLDFNGTTQSGIRFANNTIVQPGYAPAVVTNLEIDKGGVISARYSNGEQKTVGQVILANFPNQQGLQPVGNNQWIQTYRSGSPTYNDPGATNVGLIQSQAVEEANIDLTQELVSMITAQRFYQANAQTIKVQDAVMQSVINLR